MKLKLIFITLIFSQIAAANPFNCEVERNVLKVFHETATYNATYTAQAIFDEEYDKVLKNACFELLVSVEEIDPSQYDKPEKIAEVQETKDQGAAMLELLKSQGYCE